MPIRNRPKKEKLPMASTETYNSIEDHHKNTTLLDTTDVQIRNTLYLMYEELKAIHDLLKK